MPKTKVISGEGPTVPTGQSQQCLSCRWVGLAGLRGGSG